MFSGRYSLTKENNIVTMRCDIRWCLMSSINFVMISDCCFFGVGRITEEASAPSSCGFGCHRYHTGMLKPTLGGNYEYFHLQTLSNADFFEPSRACDFI